MSYQSGVSTGEFGFDPEYFLMPEKKEFKLEPDKIKDRVRLIFIYPDLTKGIESIPKEERRQVIDSKEFDNKFDEVWESLRVDSQNMNQSRIKKVVGLFTFVVNNSYESKIDSLYLEGKLNFKSEDLIVELLSHPDILNRFDNFLVEAAGEYCSNEYLEYLNSGRDIRSRASKFLGDIDDAGGKELKQEVFSEAILARDVRELNDLLDFIAEDGEDVYEILVRTILRSPGRLVDSWGGERFVEMMEKVRDKLTDEDLSFIVNSIVSDLSSSISDKSREGSIPTYSFCLEYFRTSGILTLAEADPLYRAFDALVDSVFHTVRGFTRSGFSKADFASIKSMLGYYRFPRNLEKYSEKFHNTLLFNEGRRVDFLETLVSDLGFSRDEVRKYAHESVKKEILMRISRITTENFTEDLMVEFIQETSEFIGQLEFNISFQDELSSKVLDNIEEKIEELELEDEIQESYVPKDVRRVSFLVNFDEFTKSSGIDLSIAKSKIYSEIFGGLKLEFGNDEFETLLADSSYRIGDDEALIIKAIRIAQESGIGENHLRSLVENKSKSFIEEGRFLELSEGKNLLAAMENLGINEYRTKVRKALILQSIRRYSLEELKYIYSSVEDKDMFLKELTSTLKKFTSSEDFTFNYSPTILEVINEFDIDQDLLAMSKVEKEEVLKNIYKNEDEHAVMTSYAYHDLEKYYLSTARLLDFNEQDHEYFYRFIQLLYNKKEYETYFVNFDGRVDASEEMGRIYSSVMVNADEGDMTSLYEMVMNNARLSMTMKYDDFSYRVDKCVENNPDFLRFADSCKLEYFVINIGYVMDSGITDDLDKILSQNRKRFEEIVKNSGFNFFWSEFGAGFGNAKEDISDKLDFLLGRVIESTGTFSDEFTGYLKSIEKVSDISSLFNIYEGNQTHRRLALDLISVLAKEGDLLSKLLEKFEGKEPEEIKPKQIINAVRSLDDEDFMRVFRYDIEESGGFIKDHFDLLLGYLGSDIDAYYTIYDFYTKIGGHDAMSNVRNFIDVVKAVESEDGQSRKEMVYQMLLRAGTGTGNQARMFSTIMQSINAEAWVYLENDSSYDSSSPPLSEPNSINLSVINNEIKLFHSPRVRELIVGLPEGSKLRNYSTELFGVPGIDLTAIEQFIDSPSKFFARRTGAGENGQYVGPALESLSPDKYPGWSATESRDAIVDGTYDRINTFSPVSAEWCDSPVYYECADLRNKLNYGELVALEVIDFLSDGEDDYKENSLQSLELEAFIHTCSEFPVDFVARTQEKAEQLIKKAQTFFLKRELSRKLHSISQRLVARSEMNGRPINVLKEILDQPERFKHLKDLIDEYNTTDMEVRDRMNTINKFLRSKVSGEATVQEVAEFWRVLHELGFAKAQLFNFFATRNLGIENYNLESAVGGFMSSEAGKKYIDLVLEKIADNVAESSVWYKAEVVLPSNVEMATAGTISGSCDAFGHGKKSIIMINPTAAQLLVKRSSGRGGEWGTDTVVSQATLLHMRETFATPDERQRFYESLINNSGQMAKALQAIGIRTTAEKIDFLGRVSNGNIELSLDSIEVTPNSKQLVSPSQISHVINRAFRYFEKLDPLYGGRLTAGMQYSYVQEGTPSENRATWSAPLAYTDNPHTNTSSVLLKDSTSRPSELGDISQRKFSRIRPVRGEDTFIISLMEDIAFSRSGGEGYITGLYGMGNEINASILQAEHRGHNPLSFIDRKVDQKTGKEKYLGYLISYVQRNQIYITDTATTGEEKGVGTRLLFALLQSVAADSKLNDKTIAMDCRGATSARAIAKPSSREIIETITFVDDQGRKVKFKLKGPSLEEISGDGLYEFRIVPYIEKK